MFKIDLSESFPLLSHAPIIEAVIGLTARPEITWNESEIPEQFKQRLAEYSNFESHFRFSQNFKFDPKSKPEQTTPEKKWLGISCKSENNLHVAQFNRDGFLFSRLKPYQDWEHFCGEGLRLWKLYDEIARPSEIQRMGLRFINRIEFSQDRVRLEDFLEDSPKSPRGMDIPFQAFLHHNTLSVPGEPYSINIVQTIQPPQGDAKFGVILDIDVSTTEPIVNRDLIEKHLENMRWLKNKVFFGSITTKTLEMIK